MGPITPDQHGKRFVCAGRVITIRPVPYRLVQKHNDAVARHTPMVVCDPSRPPQDVIIYPHNGGARVASLFGHPLIFAPYRDGHLLGFGAYQDITETENAILEYGVVRPSIDEINTMKLRDVVYLVDQIKMQSVGDFDEMMARHQTFLETTPEGINAMLICRAFPGTTLTQIDSWTMDEFCRHLAAAKIVLGIRAAELENQKPSGVQAKQRMIIDTEKENAALKSI